MYTLLVILAILAAIFMIGIVLIQSSKEGDLICRFGRYINLLVDKKSHMHRYLEAWIKQKSVEGMDSLSSIMMLILKKLKRGAYDNTTSEGVLP